MIKKKDITNEISFLEENLTKVHSELEKIRKDVPDGVRLRAVRHGTKYQYFMRECGSKGNGIYIRKRDIIKAKILARIEYDEKLMTLLQDSITAFKNCRDLVTDDVFEAASCLMIPGKRELVEPSYVSDKTFINKWIEQEYDGLAFRDGAPEFYTRRGLRVRSKSEIIIADILDEMEIPFLYEKPLKLKGEMIYPDFTILNAKERKEIYWEHFGMMDDKEYRDEAFMKIRKYEEDGLYQYDSVIWTFETGKIPLNTRDIRKMIRVLRARLE